jgi:hypothetical protein
MNIDRRIDPRMHGDDDGASDSVAGLHGITATAVGPYLVHLIMPSPRGASPYTQSLSESKSGRHQQQCIDE